jgi:hypothetical protein
MLWFDSDFRREKVVEESRKRREQFWSPSKPASIREMIRRETGLGILLERWDYLWADQPILGRCEIEVGGGLRSLAGERSLEPFQEPSIAFRGARGEHCKN